ncbi:MAG: YkgJ family cysteine cluster protein [Polyangiaceae bacterium]
MWSSPKRALFVFRIPRDRDRDLGVWSLLDLGKSRWTCVKSGALRGLATARVPIACLDIVRDRAERDSIHAGPTRREIFDCLACAACCKHNEVPLNRSDLATLRRARPELLKKPWVRRRRDGKLTLTLLRSGSCRHLEPGNACAIYELRPSPCSRFVIGSECCLSSREEEGVAVSES